MILTAVSYSSVSSVLTTILCLAVIAACATAGVVGTIYKRKREAVGLAPFVDEKNNVMLTLCAVSFVIGAICLVVGYSEFYAFLDAQQSIKVIVLPMIPYVLLLSHLMIAPGKMHTVLPAIAFALLGAYMLENTYHNIEFIVFTIDHLEWGRVLFFEYICTLVYGALMLYSGVFLWISGDKKKTRIPMVVATSVALLGLTMPLFMKENTTAYWEFDMPILIGNFLRSLVPLIYILIKDQPVKAVPKPQPVPAYGRPYMGQPYTQQPPYAPQQPPVYGQPPVQQPQAPAQQKGFCRACGTAYIRGQDSFCSNCGEKLP